MRFAKEELFRLHARGILVQQVTDVGCRLMRRRGVKSIALQCMARFFLASPISARILLAAA